LKKFQGAGLTKLLMTSAFGVASGGEPKNQCRRR